MYGLMTLVCLPVLGLCVRINDSSLFAWISLTALSRLCLRINDWFVCLDQSDCLVSTMCTD